MGMMMVLFTGLAAGQGNMYTCTSDQMTETRSNSTMHVASTIDIDSTNITIEQGNSHIYLSVTKITPQPDENAYYFNMKDSNDQPCFGALSIGKMRFEYQNGGYDMVYRLTKVDIPARVQQQKIAQDSTIGDIDSFKIADTMIYEHPDVAPEYPGGNGAMISFLHDHVKYPKTANGVKGFVQVSAVIEKDGHLSQVKLKKDLGGGCGAEAVRVVKLMPGWTPGEKDKEAVRCRVMINVNFMPKE